MPDSAIDGRPILLRPGVQHYAWGDAEFIPALLGVDNPDGKPWAELWMGAHPGLPSTAVVGEREVGLDRLLYEEGEAILGPRVAARFGGLPYLFKVLAAARPLSIQVHPDRRQAEEGFARENAAGVAVSAAHRSYRDPNHKPELIVALTDLYALRGFRPLDEIAAVLGETPELREFLASFERTPAGLEDLYRTLMSLPAERSARILTGLVERLREEDRASPFPEDDRRHWVLRAAAEYSPEDRGLFSVYLLNLVRLRPGEALYLPAGVLHAYLRGAGVEIMASSDNVLRGGLTAKHVDLPELLGTVRFAGERPEVLEAAVLPDAGEWVYQTPAAEFELRRLELAAASDRRSATPASAEILLVAELAPGARVTVTASRGSLELSRGGVCLIPYRTPYEVRSSGPATIWKAGVGDVSADPER
ncbi:MAG: mannose-6-phosphate isomerase, class I, partial [Planctomycetota bacterium]|nr:mannose-6-phosphate isomerase, class I [Planctomycetota bacterium]